MREMSDEESAVRIIPQQQRHFYNHQHNQYAQHYGHQNTYNHNGSGGGYHRNNTYDNNGMNSGGYHSNINLTNNSRGGSHRSRGNFYRNNPGRQQQQQNRNYNNHNSSQSHQSHHAHHNQYFAPNRPRGRFNTYNQQNHFEQRHYSNRNSNAGRTVVSNLPIPDDNLMQKRPSSSSSSSIPEQLPLGSVPYLNTSSSSSVSSDGTSPSSPREIETSHNEIALTHSENVPPMSMTVPPPSVCLISNIKELSYAIWRKYLACQQTFDMKIRKLELKRELSVHILPEMKHNFPRPYLEIVGSTVSGFGSRNCDVDICLMIRNTEVDQRIEAVERLLEFQDILRKFPGFENLELIYARVPILRFRDTVRNLDVDLNCNNAVGIRNTHLLSCYAQLDKRVQPLVVMVKLWAQFHRINDAKNMTISSYTFVLMVIHYLQFGMLDPILPCLHKDCPEKFSPFANVEQVRTDRRLPQWESRNDASVGELLLGFLEYYATKFDYGRQAVSVRLGMRVAKQMCVNTRSYKNDPHQWNRYLCVEEPFDLTNTARSVYDKDAFDRIRGVFWISWWRLNKSHSLDSIFNEISDAEAREIAVQLSPVVLRQW